MELKFNSTFKNLLDKFNLPTDLNFQIDLPYDIRQQLADTKLNVTTADDGNLSFQEDLDNHFHVDQSIDNITDKQAFELGVKTLIELSKHFKKDKVSNVQLTYSFQTPEMGQIQAKENNIDDDDDHLISDRLSFHIKRPGQIVVDKDLFNSKHFAFLTIDL